MELELNILSNMSTAALNLKNQDEVKGESINARNETAQIVSSQINKLIVRRAKKIPIFLQKHLKQKKKVLLRKKDFLVTPVVYIPQDIQDIYAEGDLILERDFLSDQDSNKKTLNWSHLKSIIQLKDIQNMNSIEVHSRVNVEQRRDLQGVIERYIITPDQKIHELGLALRQFLQHKEEYQNNFDQLLKNNPNLMETVFALQHKYTQACTDWIRKNINQDGYFFYAFGSFNKSLHQYEQNHFGFSKLLIELLGFDRETFKNHILRKGIFEFYNSFSRIENIMSKIKYGLEKWSELQRDVILLTIEDIPIYCQQRKIAISLTQFQDIIDEYNLQSFANEGWFAFTNLCGITEFFISPNQIIQVLSKRKQMQQSMICQGFDEDLRYQAQSEIFIEKYYENEFQEKINKQQQQEDSMDNMEQQSNEKSNPCSNSIQPLKQICNYIALN